MSDNKYIIDKDSLTGIADAVRDKLGTGEATTDSQTGDIVYPEDKGYYLKEETIAKISGFGWSQTDYNANFGQNYAPYISGEDWNAAVGEPWYSVEITLVNVSGRLYDMTVYYADGRQDFINVRSSTYTVSAPNGSTYFKLYFSNDYNASVYNASSSLGSLVAVFKDAEGKPIKPKQSSYHYLFTTSRIQGTANFGTVDVPTKIPFSIDDIQDRITNYLNASGGGGLKIFRCYNKNSSTSSEGDGWKVSNYLTTTAYYDLDFSSTSPYYITTQVPDLNPENIIFIWYAGRNATGSKQSYFIFEPTLKDVEHYTSASISNGKRLSSTTDYYFFPDGAGSRSTSNDYGIMGMWDANNKILDLGLQQVSSRSGTYVASDYTTQYYIYPAGLVIVYKA